MTTNQIIRSASISSCGLYRYRLDRVWGAAANLVFVMLNPSTADADIDDPTIRRCIAFAQRECAGGLTVFNLFDLRATNPQALVTAPHGPHGPCSPDNTEALTVALATRRVICAWGAHWAAESPGRAFVERAKRYRAKLLCLGRTKSGAPRHPLYVRADQRLEEYP